MSSEQTTGAVPVRAEHRKHPLISGIVFLGIGLFLLAVNYGYLPSVDESWPVIIILIGVAILISTLTRRRRS